MAESYEKRLAGFAQLKLPVEKPWAKNVYWMYGLLLNENCGIDATEFSTRMKNTGVETRPFFLGMHEQPVLQKRGFFRGERYPVAERIARQGLYLPSGLTLTEKQVDEVCDAVKKCLS